MDHLFLRLCGDERVVPCHVHSPGLGNLVIIMLFNHMVDLELPSAE